MENVLESTDGAAQLALSRSGSAIYAPGEFEQGRRLVTVDRAGTITPLAASPKGYGTPRVSPNGRTLLLSIAEATEDVWRYDLTTGALTQITSTGDARFPIWTSGGESSTFSSGAGGVPNLFSSRIAEPGSADLIASSDYLKLPGSWSPDAHLLAFVERHPTTGRDIRLLTMPERAVRPYLSTPFDESAPRFSPDGRWIAFVSNQSGRNEIYVSPVADGDARRQVSMDGGAEPVWGRNGRELFYRSNTAMMRVPVTEGRDLRFGSPQTLFEDRFDKGTIDAANYDVTSDQARFVMVWAGERNDARSALHVVVNWWDGVAPRLFPERRQSR